MDDLERVISTPHCCRLGSRSARLGPREYAFQAARLKGVRFGVSTDPTYYEQNADNVELWSPGNPTFPSSAIGPEAVQVETLTELLQLPAEGCGSCLTAH